MVGDDRNVEAADGNVLSLDSQPFQRGRRRSVPPNALRLSRSGVGYLTYKYLLSCSALWQNSKDLFNVITDRRIGDALPISPSFYDVRQIQK